MKCWHITKSKKEKLTKAQERKLQGIVDEFFAKSLVVGPKKAIEIMKEERKDDPEGQTSDEVCK